MFDRKMGLNRSLRGRKYLKIWDPEYFLFQIDWWGPRGPRALKNIEKKLMEKSTFHEFLIQGGLGGAEHPPARYKV